MSYADIVATIALFAALVSLGWQIYTWLYQEKQKEALSLIVCIKKNRIERGKILPVGISLCSESFLYIQNRGALGVTVLKCEVNNTSIAELREDICEPEKILGAKIEPLNSISCELCFAHRKINAGDCVKLTCKFASGKIAEKEYTLSEEPR